MKSTKILALVLAVLMLLSTALAGCSKDEGKKDSDVVVKTEEKENSSLVYDAEVHDLGGHKFYFLVRDAGKYSHLQPNEIFAEELNGDKVNDAVFRRNSNLQEKLNCEIFEERTEDPTGAIKEQLLSGEYQYDFIYTCMTKLRSLSASNLLVDFHTLENVDLNKGWWDQRAIEGFSIAGKAYYVTGDASTMDERAACVIYFNRDLVERARLESPYTLVKEGKWTVDKMLEYVNATSEDLDGNGIMEIGKDRFGYVGEPINNWFHVAACNVKLSRSSASGDLEIPSTVSDEVLEAWAALKPLLTSSNRIVSDASKYIRQETGVFFGAMLAASLILTTNETLNYGILPMPKMNEEQDGYYTSINGFWTYGYAIPVTTDNATDAEANGFASGSEQAAYFLEAFSYYSRDTVNVAFYDQVIKHQVIRDEESLETLEIAVKNKIYDPIVIFDFGKIGASLFKEVGSQGGKTGTEGTEVVGNDTNYDTLVSTYEARLKAARKALINYIDYITNED